MNKIPNGIYEVPTIIVHGFNTPLCGDNVFGGFQQNTQAPPTLKTNPVPEPVSVATREEPTTRTSGRDARPDFSAPPSLGNPIDRTQCFWFKKYADFLIYILMKKVKKVVQLNHSFEFVGGNIVIPLSTKSNTSNIPQLPSTKTTKQSKGDILNKKYEDFMNSRNNDPVCNSGR